MSFMNTGVSKGCLPALDKEEVYIPEVTSSELILNFMNSMEGIAYQKGYANPS